METYVELLVIAGALLAGSLELLAHLADLLVNLGVLCGRHVDVSAANGKRIDACVEFVVAYVDCAVVFRSSC